MSTDIIMANGKQLANQDEASDKLIEVLRASGLNEDVIAIGLKDIIENAEVQNNKGDVITDYQTKLSALKTLYRMLTNKPETQVNIAQFFSGNNGI